VAEQELPGGWLPPQAAGGAPAPSPASPSSPEPDPQRPVFVQPHGEQGTNGLAVAALVCAISSIGLLVFSLGLSFLFSIPLGLTGWVCAARAPQDVRPGQRKAAKVLAIIAVGLSVAAAIAWLALMAAGYSPEDLQRSLEEELERQRQSS
jgi:NADH:ubiquinone oxidoreductase subunit K